MASHISFRVYYLLFFFHCGSYLNLFSFSLFFFSLEVVSDNDFLVTYTHLPGMGGYSDWKNRDVLANLGDISQNDDFYILHARSTDLYAIVTANDFRKRGIPWEGGPKRGDGI